MKPKLSLETSRITLSLQSHEEVLSQIERMNPAEKAQLSSAWLDLLSGSTSANPWIHGFTIFDKANGTRIGTCGFKGPRDLNGMVEIAYGIDPQYQNRSYATEAAVALLSYAFNDEAVRLARAHTLPEPNASGRVLTKCGFRFVGEVTDPEDGLVWRWEKARPEDPVVSR